MAEENTCNEAATARSLRRLRRLIAALDRRVPRVERAGEIAIAHDAAALRKEAVARIAELEAAADVGGVRCSPTPHERQPATSDQPGGGPSVVQRRTVRAET